MLDSIVVKIGALMLDPNNPRLVTTINLAEVVLDKDAESRQTDILAKFTENVNGTGDEDASDEFFGIKDLMDSMRTIGYVPIDRIVVRKLDDEKYLVIEGNRRVSAIKRLMDQYENGLPENKRDLDNVVDTFKELEVLELVTTGLTAEEVEKRINIILGLRHYGSLLGWEPLPKAYNTYHNYMILDPELAEFEDDRKRVREVASRLSISGAEVTRALRTYVAYLQLASEFEGVDPEYYSLILAGITNKNLQAHNYFPCDEKTYRLAQESLRKIVKVCQFADRKKLHSSHIILNEPKAFNALGKLVKKAEIGDSAAVRDYAKSLLRQVESGEIDSETDRLSLTLDEATSALEDFETSTRWVPTLRDLLRKQEKELTIEEYAGDGNDLLRKNELEKSLGIFRKIFGV